MQRARRNSSRKGIDEKAPPAAAAHVWTTATSAKSPSVKEINGVEIRVIMYNKGNKGRWKSSLWLTYKRVKLREIIIRGQ